MKFQFAILLIFCVLLSIASTINCKLVDTKDVGIGSSKLVTSHPRSSKESRERFLGDGSFTLGYSTRYNFGGGFGSGYPGHGHGLGYGVGYGFRPSVGYGFSHGYGYGHHGHGYYDPYYKPYHHHAHHHGGFSGGYGFKHQFHQGGYGAFGYPGYY